MSEKRVAVFFAEGFEEIEALTTVDLLKRASIKVDMVSITNEKVLVGAHDITIIADERIKEVDLKTYDAFVLPGGMPGTLNLGECKLLMTAVKEHFLEGKLIAAICAAPSLLGKLGILKEKRACCYPSFEEKLEGAIISMNKVEVDGNVITSRGAGTAIDFALAIIKMLVSEEESKRIAGSILLCE